MTFLETLLGPLFVTFIIGIFSFLLLLWYSIKKQSYWKEKNVPHAKPLPFFGNILEYRKKLIHDFDFDYHSKLGPIYGYYEGNSPILSVTDPKLLKGIFVKDFQNFQNLRTLKIGSKVEDNLLIFLKDEDWKRIRSILTPTFTTAKLKRLVSIFEDCSKTLIKNFKKSEIENKPINVQKFFSAFSMDAIASSCFSTKIDSNNDPGNPFVLNARAAFGFVFHWRLLVYFISPRLAKLLKTSYFNPVSIEYFTRTTAEIIAERKRTKQTRNDFLQLLLDIVEENSKTENFGETNDDGHIREIYGKDFGHQEIFDTTYNKSLSMDELVGASVNFILAGYDTMVSLMTFVAYCLALNTHVQEKTYIEITRCLKETNGELTYEALKNMKYLDNVISETLRLYPPSHKVERKSQAEYKLGDTGITLGKDMIVTIPIFTIHRNPKYYPNPEKFDPDRFLPEETAKRDAYTFLPFGHGPRNCIGMKLSLIEAKVCLVYVLSHFKITPSDKTEIPIKFRHNNFYLLQPADVFLALESRHNCPLKS